MSSSTVNQILPIKKPSRQKWGKDLYLPANSCAQVLHDDPIVCPCWGSVPENMISLLGTFPSVVKI